MVAHLTESDPTRTIAVPPQDIVKVHGFRLAGDEIALLTPADRGLLTPEVVERWANDLGPDDLVFETLLEILELERRRQRALRTLRASAELTDLEFRFVRYLQRNERKTRNYVQIAHHLWGTPSQPVTAAHLRNHHGYASSMVAQIQSMMWSIRRKLEIDPSRPQHFASVRGVGYRYYSDPPSLDDGENYTQRATETVVLREQMQRELGLFEGDVLIELPPHWEPGAPLLGPELLERDAQRQLKD